MAVVVIDYGAGNLQSVLNALDFLNCPYTVATNGDDIAVVSATYQINLTTK